MANTIGWGKATQNNDNGFGKYQNTIGAASIYAESYAGETAIVGTSAAFSYSASTFTQADADPTPTITGTTGGTFNASSGLVFVDTGTFNSSTGQIDLSASTIDSHIITYTVDGVQSGQTVGITAAPYSSTRSFSFDGVNDYFSSGNPTELQITGNLSISFWFKTSSASNMRIAGKDGGSASNRNYTTIISSGLVGFKIYKSDTGASVFTTGTYNDGNWHNAVAVNDGSDLKIYIDGSLKNTNSGGGGTIDNDTVDFEIGRMGNNTKFFNGNLDEVSIWNSALSSDAVTEIYNSGAANDLESLTNASSSNLVAWYKMGEDSTFSTSWSMPNSVDSSNTATSFNMDITDLSSDTP